MEKLAIIIPCYNEEACLNIAAETLLGVLDDLAQKGKIASDSFLLFVNDGSTDRTWSMIEDLHQSKPEKIVGVKLSGNVGHQNALTAGLLTAKDMCDVTVSIDADLQDDVSAIEEMIDAFHQGKDIVYGVRKDRQADTFFKRATAQGFYKFMGRLGVKTIYNHADFRLMSKRALEAFSQYQETHLYLRGVIPLLGYETGIVTYNRKQRVAGESKYPKKKMMALAFDGISSFSVKPVSMVLTMGIIILILSVLAAIYAFVSYVTGNVEPGWTSLILSIWFLGGLQLIAIGLVGLYVGKIFEEVKHRPRYNIEQILSSKTQK